MNFTSEVTLTALGEEVPRFCAYAFSRPSRDPYLRRERAEQAQELVPFVLAMKDHTPSAKLPTHIHDVAFGFQFIR
ncbi:hypothetical protein ABTL77_20425, partial [Acinetobacter baumannii]